MLEVEIGEKEDFVKLINIYVYGVIDKFLMIYICILFINK